MNNKRFFNARLIVRVGLLAAIATILMLFEFPIPFLAPGFYEMDFSEVPILIGAFLMGPLAGCLIELIKILMNLAINGTVTAGVGEFANFVIGCSLIAPTAWMYRRAPSRQQFVLAAVVGVCVMTIVAAFMNYYVMLPLYSKAFNLPLQAFIDMGSAVNAKIVDLRGFILLAVVPFNIVKGIVVTLIASLLYDRIGGVLKR